MRELQIEHRVWVTKKYPNQAPKTPAVGCLEEAGELVHAIAKIEQIQTWGEDSRHKLAELRVKLVDAIGDCGIFVCSLCNANEWDFQDLWEDSEEMYTVETLLDEAVLLARWGTYVAVYPSDKLQLSFYISQLKAVAKLLGLDAETAIKATWEIVKCR